MSKDPEIFIGLVGAVGTDLDKIVQALKLSLNSVRYECRIINLIEQLKTYREYSGLLSEDLPVFERYKARMDAGDKFRRSTGLGDALARLSIISIRDHHRKLASPTKDPKQPIPRCAYIFKSLKHPEEIDTLRTIYGSHFFVISAYAPRDIRVQNLALRIASSKHDSQPDKHRHEAEILVERDEDDHEHQLGQKVRSTFPKADLFVDSRDLTKIKKEISRFVELLFGNTFRTPSVHEFGMFHAQAAALRSAAPGRQVGAAISTSTGEIVAVGTNEVPKFGGGQYWEGDSDDKRDFHFDIDPSVLKRKEMLAELMNKLVNAKWFAGSMHQGKSADDLVDEAGPLLKGTRLMNLTEFGREVHAEMAALMDAAKRGVAVKSRTMYTTTFPCHNCAKHIVASGLEQVIYIEPYPKSLAALFHLDSVTVDGSVVAGNKVAFQPFEGIAPRLYMKLFEMLKRKSDDGKIIQWDSYTANPRFALSRNVYLENEVAEAALLVEKTNFDDLI